METHEYSLNFSLGKPHPYFRVGQFLAGFLARFCHGRTIFSAYGQEKRAAFFRLPLWEAYLVLQCKACFEAWQQETYLDIQPYLPVTTATMPNTTAKPKRKYRAILLKSKKPLPVTVTAPMIAMTVNTAIITLVILQMAFFMAILHIISELLTATSFCLVKMALFLTYTWGRVEGSSSTASELTSVWGLILQITGMASFFMCQCTISILSYFQSKSNRQQSCLCKGTAYLWGVWTRVYASGWLHTNSIFMFLHFQQHSLIYVSFLCYYNTIRWWFWMGNKFCNLNIYSAAPIEITLKQTVELRFSSVRCWKNIRQITLEAGNGMKKIPMIIVSIAPYFLFGMYMTENLQLLSLGMIAFGIIMVFGAVYAFFLPRMGFSGKQILFWSMLLKICNIPIFLFVFAIGLFLFVVIIPLIPLLFLFDLFLMLSTSMYGINGIIQCGKEKCLSKKRSYCQYCVTFYFLRWCT